MLSMLGLIHPISVLHSHHLALNWNLGEENSQTGRQRKAMARTMRALDPYGHHIVIHNKSPPASTHLDRLLTPMLGNESELTGASIQTDFDDVHRHVVHWSAQAALAGQQWVISNGKRAVG